MAILKVITYPDPVLSEVSKEVGPLSPEDRKFIVDLIETMYEYDGVGIAAPQVGVSRRIIVVSPEAKPGKEIVYLNPVIVKQEGEEIGPEGCLSLPGISGEVLRAVKIRVRALGLDGKKIEFEASNFHARIIQHEIDHLNGKLFIDHLGFRKRQEVAEKLRTLKQM